MKQNSTQHLLARLRMRQIALILAIEEHTTLRSAADEIGLSQPAATKMLHELEHTFGQPLFDRVGRGLQLNAAGARVLGYFQGIRGSIEALNRELIDLQRGGAGKLALGSIVAASSGRLTDTILEIKAKYPSLTISVNFDTSDRLMSELLEGKIEVVIGRNFESNHKDYVFHSIGDETLVIIAGKSHPLALKKEVKLSDLMSYPWVLQPNGSPARAVVENEFRAHNMRIPDGLIETPSILTMIDLVDRSAIIGVIPEDVALRNQEYGIISILKYKLLQRLSSYGVIVRRDRPLSPSAQHFLDLFLSRIDLP